MRKHVVSVWTVVVVLLTTALACPAAGPFCDELTQTISTTKLIWEFIVRHPKS